MRNWTYFRPVIEQRGKLWERFGINTRAVGGALSRCLVCLKADVEPDRRDREARAARAGVPMPGNTKTKARATCITVKPLTAFARDAPAIQCSLAWSPT